MRVSKLNKKQSVSNGERQGEDAQRSDLLVARNNGRIEIYSYDEDTQYPQMCFEKQIQSTITGIDFGNITMANSKDVILSCYDGQVLALIDTKKFKKQGIMGQED